MDEEVDSIVDDYVVNLNLKSCEKVEVRSSKLILTSRDPRFLVQMPKLDIF